MGLEKKNRTLDLIEVLGCFDSIETRFEEGIILENLLYSRKKTKLELIESKNLINA